MSWKAVFENPSSTSVCFDVRSGAGTVRGDGTFSDVVDVACRTPKRHAGWESVEYKGHRYALRGGIRTRHFITLTLPVVQQRDNPTPVARAMSFIRGYRDQGVSWEAAARTFMIRYPRLALDVMDRVGSWPSSEPEIRALQEVWR